MLEPGTIVDDLVIEGLLGQGSHAAIFQVITTEGVLAALKVLTSAQPVAMKRLREEGRVLMGIEHPNILGVYRVLEVRGVPAILLELVEGPTLGSWLDARGQPPIPEALELFKGIARGVQVAHAHGLVHRDLNPGNVLLATRADKRVVPKVADFGIARALARDSQLTAAGPLGTPAYVAPEQWRDARNADHRSDLFSLGCILYELITGAQAFPGGDIEAFRAASLGDYLKVRRARPDCPEFVEQVIDRLLAPDPHDRFQDVASALEVLFLDDVPEIGAEEHHEEQWSVSAMTTRGASLARHLAPPLDTDTTVRHPLEPTPQAPPPEMVDVAAPQARAQVRLAVAAMAALLVIGAAVLLWVW